MRKSLSRSLSCTLRHNSPSPNCKLRFVARREKQSRERICTRFLRIPSIRVVSTGAGSCIGGRTTPLFPVIRMSVPRPCYRDITSRNTGSRKLHFVDCSRARMAIARSQQNARKENTCITAVRDIGESARPHVLQNPGWQKNSALYFKASIFRTRFSRSCRYLLIATRANYHKTPEPNGIACSSV